MTSPSALQSFRLDGRSVFVSGAAGHLGRAISLALSDAGARVLLNGRNEASLARLADEIERRGGLAEPVPFDVGDFARVRDFFGALSRLDVVVNNAITMTPKPFDAVTGEAFDEAYRTAVMAPFEIARAARSALRNAVQEGGDASIVNISSMYGCVAPDRRIYSHPEQASPVHYGPAKAALLQLTRHLAAELGPEGVRVNAVVPGPFPRDAVASDDPDFAARLASRTMLGRTGEARDICGPLLFLASSASRFVTGVSLPVDGGWTAW